MAVISLNKLQKYRSSTFYLDPKKRVHSPAQALQFVNERGFVFFWPVKGFEYPSLWSAHAGNRPVASEHDDPGHATWGWKDDSLDKRWWYYAKIIRHKGTFISLQMIPYFYALSPNYGTPEEDYLLEYEEGKLTQECKLIFEALLKEGPLDTLSLRKAAHLSSTDSSGRFNKAITDLQYELKVLPIGTAEVGAWKYAYIYDLTHRHFPNLITDSQDIKESSARLAIMTTYFQTLGAARIADFLRMFPWAPIDVERTVNKLIAAGTLTANNRFESRDDYLVIDTF